MAKKVTLTSEQKHYIEISYKLGISISQISKDLCLGYGIVNSYLIDNDFKVVKHDKMSPDKYKKIIELIKDGHHLAEIVRMTVSEPKTIKLIAKENNLTLQEFTMPRDPCNKDFDDNYFEKIDTEAKAYFLGLIYTDGCVRIHNGGYFLGLQLQISDKPIIEKLAEELKCGNSVRERKTNGVFNGTGVAEFESCNSKKLFDDLARFDIVPDKTHNSITIKNIKELVPKHLIKHFIRGVIDGDGSIAHTYYHGKGIMIYQNSMQFCEDMQDLIAYAMDDYTLHGVCTSRPVNMFVLRYRRINEAIKLLKFLYEDATVYIQRKYDVASEYFNYEPGPQAKVAY